jgi:RNAse (barnase) inhibitor barstar
MTAIESAISEIEKSDELLITVSGDFGIQDLVYLLNDRDYHAIIIDRAPVNSRDTLMHAMYQNLRFPGYFGFTWDSLKDVLAGMDGVRSKGFIFAFSDFSLLSDEDRNEFLEVIEDANELRESHDDLENLRVLTLKA